MGSRVCRHCHRHSAGTDNHAGAEIVYEQDSNSTLRLKENNMTVKLFDESMNEARRYIADRGLKPYTTPPEAVGTSAKLIGEK